MKDFILTNTHESIDEARVATDQYLEEHPELSRLIGQRLRAGRHVDGVVPTEAHEFLSGHNLPALELHVELEAAYHLAARGFYPQAWRSLRKVLEMGILQASFITQHTSTETIKEWTGGRERTPRFNAMLDKLAEQPLFEPFDRAVGYERDVRAVWDHLGGFVHTRGARFSAAARPLGNITHFSAERFENFAKMLDRTVSLVVKALFIAWPVGLYDLPITEKFGFAGRPWSGFAEGLVHRDLVAALSEAEYHLLRDAADQDKRTQAIADDIRSRPDLTREELMVSAEDQRYLVAGCASSSPVEEHRMLDCLDCRMVITAINPDRLCLRHLLCEHRYVHIVWDALTRMHEYPETHPSYDDAMPVFEAWDGRLRALQARHDELADELEARGYRHMSDMHPPLDAEWVDPGLADPPEKATTGTPGVVVPPRDECTCDPL